MIVSKRMEKAPSVSLEGRYDTCDSVDEVIEAVEDLRTDVHRGSISRNEEVIRLDDIRRMLERIEEMPCSGNERGGGGGSPGGGLSGKPGSGYGK